MPPKQLQLCAPAVYQRRVTLCCLHLPFVAKDVCFVIVQRGIAASIYFSTFLPLIMIWSWETLEEVTCGGAVCPLDASSRAGSVLAARVNNMAFSVDLQGCDGPC